MITPILRKPHTDAEAQSTEDNAEARMRQALLKLGTARPGRAEAPRKAAPYQVKPGTGRHRFKQDGEVPVVRLTLAPGDRSRERQPPAPAGIVRGVQAKAGEGHNQGGCESARQMQELTEQLRTMQTRLGHAELALQEADREAQAWQEERAGLRHALDAAEAALAHVRAELVASERAREELERRREAAPPSGPKADEQDGAATRRKVGRPLGSTNRVRDQGIDSNSEPVKWWVGD